MRSRMYIIWGDTFRFIDVSLSYMDVDLGYWLYGCSPSFLVKMDLIKNNL